MIKPGQPGIAIYSTKATQKRTMGRNLGFVAQTIWAHTQMAQMSMVSGPLKWALSWNGLAHPCLSFLAFWVRFREIQAPCLPEYGVPRGIRDLPECGVPDGSPGIRDVRAGFFPSVLVGDRSVWKQFLPAHPGLTHTSVSPNGPEDGWAGPSRPSAWAFCNSLIPRLVPNLPTKDIRIKARQTWARAWHRSYSGHSASGAAGLASRSVKRLNRWVPQTIWAASWLKIGQKK